MELRPSMGWGGAGGLGAPTYDSAKLSKKLHEIEQIFRPSQGGGGGWAPPVDPTMKGESPFLSITSLTPEMNAHTDNDLICEGPVL